MAFAVINEDTGEIIRRIEDGDRIIKKEQSEYARTHIMNFNADKPFAKFYLDIVPLLTKYLTANETKLLISLMPYIKYEDCTIEKIESGHSKILNLQDLSEETGLDYNFVKRYMRNLKQKGIVGLHETGTIFENRDTKMTRVYTVNPYIFFRGKNVNATLCQFYRDSGWKELLGLNEETDLED